MPALEFFIDDALTARRCGELLAASPNIHRSRRRLFQSTVYDSFDGRVWGHGMVLHWIEQSEGNELQLDPRDQGRRGWRQPLARAPEGVGAAIDHAVIRARLNRWLGPRALLPMVTLTVRRQSFRFTGEEEKTCAWVHMDRVKVDGADKRASALPLRLIVEPLRGYGKSAQRLAAYVAGEAGLTPDHDGMFSRAMACAGVDFEHRRAKFKIPLQSEMRTDAALIEALKELLAALEMNEGGATAGWDTEFLHDFRIAVRRTRSLFGQVKHVFPAADIESFRRELAWLGQITTLPRDLDVYLLKMPRFRDMLQPDLRDDLEPLAAMLLKRQKAERRKLAKALTSKRYQSLKRRWRSYLDLPVEKAGAGAIGPMPVRATANKRIWATYKKVCKHGRGIDDGSPAERLHELRKICKQLRYLIEFFQTLYDQQEVDALIRELKRLQDNLGEFQDLDVQIGGLRGFARDLEEAGNSGTLLAMGALLNVLNARKRQVRIEFKRRYQPFDSGRTRNRFRRLVNGGAAP